MHVREVRDDERDWLRATIGERWGDEIAVGRGRVWTPHELPAMVAVDDSGERVGVATYVVEGAVAEMVSIDALRSGAGVGRRLLDAIAATARAAGAEQLLVMATNDNLAALRFYQRNGFRLAELRPGGVDEARATFKPSITGDGERWYPPPRRDRPPPGARRKPRPIHGERALGARLVQGIRDRLLGN